MPTIRKVYSRKPVQSKDFLDPSRFGDRLQKRAIRLNKAENKIMTSPHQSALIPYVVRALLDISEKKQVTTMQRRIAEPFLSMGVANKFIERYRDLPPKLGATLGSNVFKLPTGKDADQWLINIFRNSAVELERSNILKNEFIQIDGVFSDVYFGNNSGNRLASWWKDSRLQPIPKCPEIYQARLEYRGITTHHVGDRSGGVEPYLVAATFRIACGSSDVQEITSPIVIKQKPADLGNMGDGIGFWKPSGGSQDQYGNPSNPHQFLPKICREQMIDIPGFDPIPVTVCGWKTDISLSPMLLGQDMHYAVVSVWEEDGDQSQQVMRQLGNMMVKLGGVLLSIPGAQVGGIVVISLGAIIDLASFLTASDDDRIGSFVLLLDKNTLSVSGYREISYRVKESGGDNDWTIWLGLETKRLQGS